MSYIIASLRVCLIAAAALFSVSALSQQAIGPIGGGSSGSPSTVIINPSGNTVTTAGRPVTAVDKSSTITSGGNAQTLAAANAARTCFEFQNQSTGDLWISDVGTAAAAQPSKWFPAGAYYSWPPTMVPVQALSIFGATTGQAFMARECTS